MSTSLSLRYIQSVYPMMEQHSNKERLRAAHQLRHKTDRRGVKVLRSINSRNTNDRKRREGWDICNSRSCPRSSLRGWASKKNRKQGTAWASETDLRFPSRGACVADSAQARAQICKKLSPTVGIPPQGDARYYGATLPSAYVGTERTFSPHNAFFAVG